MFDLKRTMVERFLKSSRQCIEAVSRELDGFKAHKRRKVHLFSMKQGKADEVTLDGGHFFLRTSVEYSNPQLTVEEVQGIAAARMLEVCGNHFHENELSEADEKDVDEICDRLRRPPQGLVFPFLLNTDDVEPDRYSMNPLKESIVDSGQSAFPSSSVKTEELNIDSKFMRKYEGSLISRDEAELIEQHLETCKDSYTNMVEAVKYEQLRNLSESFGIDLCLYSLRMPITALAKESKDGLLHYIIRKSHKDYESIERIYNCMGRSMKKRTTLLTVPHSEKGYGSKRAVRGKIYFKDHELKSVKVTYRTTPLYPNAIDTNDVSIAKADDRFTIVGERLTDYDFTETPSSPQFILYAMGSPEDAVIWHGIGAFGASQLVRSYTTTRLSSARGSIIKGLHDKYGITTKIPIQFNLEPENMWVHPKYDNIDASIGCVEDLRELAKKGLELEHLPTYDFVRNKIEI